jgi:hypothetical protein
MGLFSKSVSVTMRREFADPKISFEDTMSKENWDGYYHQ